MRTTRAPGALALGLTLALTACGNDTDAASGDTASQTTSTDHNDADVEFAQGMVPHHRQAVEMAQMAQDSASSAEVEDLAAEVEAAQDPEVQTMTGWLEAWGEDVPTDDSMSGMDHDMGSMGSMPGMMTDQDMTDLEDAQGTDFDRMFLTMMVEHHTGAIQMARTEQANGENPDAVALAERIEADQTAEIEQMNDLLDALGS